jgi:glycosyltransferase involved in cell wall biosynthesis
MRHALAYAGAALPPFTAVRVAVVAEWYPSRADPVHGIWAHRQAMAARDAGAEVRVLAFRRPVPPLRVARAGPRAVAGWIRDVPAAMLAPYSRDGIVATPVPFLAPPRPLSYGGWSWWMAAPLARALRRLHSEWPFDLVHAHSILPPGHAVHLARRAAPHAAFVVSTHGPDILEVAGNSGAAARATATTLTAADLVIANSAWAERRCRELAGADIRSAVVHLGADLGPEPPPRDPARPPVIVTVAHLVARKRHAVVLHALAAIPPERRPRYLVIGDGPGREPLARMAHELGLGDDVRFTGQLDHGEALAEAARCDLFVMPGVQEPFGVAFVEAMAAGLPAIGARGEGGPEDIAAAGPGMELVPPDDHVSLAAAIEALLSDRERLAALGRAARETVRAAFTWERCGTATVAAYERALGR